MRLDRMFLLGVCAISLCVGGVSQSHGAGMLREMTGVSTSVLRRAAFSAVRHQTLKPAFLLNAVRHCSTKKIQEVSIGNPSEGLKDAVWRKEAVKQISDPEKRTEEDEALKKIGTVIQEQGISRESSEERELREIKEGLMALMKQAEVEKGCPLTERERARYNISHHVLSVKKQARARAYEKAFEKGFEKGKKNAAIKVARRMLEDKHPLDLIIKVTGLTEDEIREKKP
jgi:hypothetical protein